MLVVFSCCVEQAAKVLVVSVRAGQSVCMCPCPYVCVCTSRCCVNRRAFVHIYDGPVVFDDEIAYVTNAADCKYCICCVVFGLRLVLVVLSRRQ